MYKNSISILILIIVISFTLNAQISSDFQLSKDNTVSTSAKGNPDVIFKVTGFRDAYENLILDLPEGANFEHIGDGVIHITGMPDVFGFYKIGIKAGGNILNGVTTNDISLIQRHIMGNGSLANQFKLTAADVDCDGRVSVLDMIQIRRVIVGHISEFGCKTNYKFWPENIEFYWEGSRVDAGEYMPIKLGDVNGSAAYNSGSLQQNGN
jgi:hypothetical protein